MLRVLRNTICSCAVGLTLGCFAPLAEYTFVTTQSATLRVEVLKEEASGWTCVVQTILDPIARIPLPWREMKLGIPNQAFAVEMALRTVPDADVLLDTTFTPHVENRVLWAKSCLTVTGKAARVLP